jgi:hypothetical protein
MRLCRDHHDGEIPLPPQATSTAEAHQPLAFFELMNEDDVVQKENNQMDAIFGWTGSEGLSS